MFLFVASPDAEQAFLQQDPEKRPSGQGSFKEAVLCEGKRKNKELLNGPGVVNEERTRSGLGSKSNIFGLENF